MIRENYQEFECLLDKILDWDPGFCYLLDIIRSVPPNNFFISGGTVRDVLLNNDHRIKDIDIFLTTEGFDFISGFLKANGDLIANQFGTNRWYPESNKKIYYDIIRIPRFYNGLWTCRNITDVLNQFDMTANAIAFDLLNGEFYNPQNGLDDINNHILRAVRFDFPDIPVSKEIEISRNTVLWFRYTYYAKKLHFDIEPITLKWINENKFREKDLKIFEQYFFHPYVTT